MSTTPSHRRVIGKTLPLVRASSFKTALRCAPAAPQTTFAAEQMIDELAYAAKMDPLAFRRAEHRRDDRTAVSRWLSVLDAVGEGCELAAAGRGLEPVERQRRDAVAASRSALRKSSLPGVVADIEVNKKTGKIVVKHIYAAQDAGLAVNPALSRTR